MPSTPSRWPTSRRSSIRPSIWCVCSALCRGLVDCLHAAHASGALGSGRRAVIDAGNPLTIGTLPELPGRDTVDADVQLLSGLLADLTGCTRVGVRIEVLDRAMCPRWHVDRVALRLLCTWIGPMRILLLSNNP